MLRYTVILSICLIYSLYAAAAISPCTEGQPAKDNCTCVNTTCTSKQYCYNTTTQYCFDACTDKQNVKGDCQCGTAPKLCLQGSYCEANSCLPLCKPNTTNEAECQCGTVQCKNGDVCDSAKSVCSKPTPATTSATETSTVSNVTTTTQDPSVSDGYGAGIVFCE